MPFPYPTRMDRERKTPAQSAVEAREGRNAFPQQMRNVFDSEATERSAVRLFAQEQ